MKRKPRVKVSIVYQDNYCGGAYSEKMKYAKPGDSGFDLRAAIGVPHGSWTIPAGAVAVIPTGIRVAVPEGFELQVRTRSGSALKSGYVVANSPGTVDSGYRGEVGVIVHNISGKTIRIDYGDRIAQGVICPVYQAYFDEVTELDETERGTGAYNSTGVK